MTHAYSCGKQPPPDEGSITVIRALRRQQISQVGTFPQMRANSTVMNRPGTIILRLGMLLCCAALLLAASGGARAACTFPPQGEGRVGDFIDARTFRLDDGREIRLAGIEIPPEDLARTDTLAALIGGRDVTLHGPDDAPDRYGRQPAFVTAQGARNPVQINLVAQGRAMVAATVADPACSSALQAGEAAARAAGRGLWADPAALKNAERPDDIMAARGRFAVVEGKVVSARLSGATFYVNFSRRWTQGFAVTISRRMMPAFAAAGIDLKSLENKRIRVRGWIEDRGGPRIEVTRAGQIELVDAATTTAKDVTPEDEGK
jgi:endonuclease YncB( thermonuclease family)